MKKLVKCRSLAVAACALCTTALAADAFKDLVKIIGVGAAVNNFAPKFNDAINRLSGHNDSSAVKTKVVPIISGGINSRKAIGAAQVMGPADKVDRVKAVAQLDQDLLGKEVKIRAMIPIETQQIVSNIKRVDGVGISGIVDLKL